MDVIAGVQRALLDEEVVLFIDADILLPKIGGYNAKPYSFESQLYELPRPSEVKALWRWWLRVILSGVYGGQKTYSKLDKEIGKILGSTQKQSLFSVIVDVDNAEQILEQSKDKMKQFEQLLLKVIPEVLKTFVNKYNSNYELKKISKLDRLRFIPISIRFTSIPSSSFNNFKHKVKEEFGLEPRPIKKGKEAECKIENSEKLLELMKRLGINFDERTKGIIQLYDEIVKLTKISRIKLLKQPRKEEGEEDEVKFEGQGFEFKLSKGNKKFLKRILEDIVSIVIAPAKIPVRIAVATNNNKELDLEKLKLALTSLLLSLLLGGLGSIKGRGFGSLVLKNIRPGLKYGNLLKESIEKVNKILQANDESELKKRFIEYIEFVFDLANKVYGNKATYVYDEDLKMPRVPALLPDTDYFKLEVFECNKHRDIVSILECIGKATLKAEWKREYGISEKEPGGEFHTWILGLPRSMKNTGYFVDGDKGRRPSAITFKIFENKQGKKFVIIYGFLSHDWPLRELIHKGKHYRRGKKVTELGIRTLSQQKPILSPKENEYLKYVFEAAFEFVTKIIEKECKV